MPSVSNLARWIGSRDRIGALNEPRVATLVAPRGNPKPHKLIERCCWLVGVLASGIAIFLLSTLGVAMEIRSLALSLVLMLFLVAIYLVYGKWRPVPVLSNIGGAIAVLFLSIGAAGIISLVGLRYHYPLIDDALANSDRSLGIDLPSIISWFADHPALSNLLGFAYDSSFVQLLGLVVLLAFLGRADKLWELVFVCSLTIVASTTVSIFWPAIGAFAYFDYLPNVLAKLPPNAGTYHLAKFEYFRNAASPVISFDSLQGVVTFPSFHCCLALMTIFAVTGIRWLFWIVAAWNVLVLISTLPIGGHYAVDLAGGTLLWLASVALAAVLSRESPRETILRNRLMASEAGVAT